MLKNKIKVIKFYANRPDRGATGGPGGVLFLQKYILGNTFENVVLKYYFSKENKFFKRHQFIYIFFKILFKELFNFNSYYICNEIDSAFALALLKKPYSLIYHQQGPIVEEKTNFGVKLNFYQKFLLHFIERVAFINAKTLHFPSKGAEDMYFISELKSCKKNQVRIGQVVPNTIEQSPLTSIEFDPNCLTFLSIGSLTKAKGQDKTLQYIGRFLEKYNGKVRYIMIGRGPLEKELVLRGKELENSHTKFEFIHYDRISHSEVLRLNKISDVYIMLHRISIFDLATLEAMDNSCAIVLSNIGGNIDFNKDNNIIFVDDNNFEKSINELINSDIDDLKKKNNEVFKKYFSNISFKNTYENLISNIILNDAETCTAVERNKPNCL